MMKNKYLINALLILTLISGCKDDQPVETPINTNQNPNAPQLLSPADNSTIEPVTPTLSWESFPNTSTYRVQISLDANFAGTMIKDTNNISGIQLTVPGGLLTTNVYYYWRVIANIQGGGTSNWSATWRFKIILAPPPPPVLLSPLNNSTNQSFTPLFDWGNSPTAETYRIQVSVNSNFSYNVLDSSLIPVSELQCPPLTLINNTLYYWRVNASNSNGGSTSNWSTVFNFRTIDGPLPNSISGTITFVDTNFLPLPDKYMVAAFPSNGKWPPIVYIPAGDDSLIIERVGNVYRANYTIRNLLNGTYYITSLAISFPPLVEVHSYLGIYGCDTVHIPFSSCPLNPTGVTITNNFGVENINFLSWADTTKKIF
ncbi:MAG: hypothetical protein L0Y79_08610 [Chlorobi bacterium]|nr:hypothetical protein [Chlorobiota bacterium]MCI0715981.1 hypothetical protein [Chlorobiota bacterium]